MELNKQLADIQDKIMRLEIHLNMLDEEQSAQNLVLSWILAKLPKHEVTAFLANQANVLDGNPKFEEDVALLDDLRDSVSQWQAQWSSDPNIPR